MTIEKQVVMKLDVVHGQQRAFADAAMEARRLRDSLPKPSDSTGIDLAGRRAGEMARLVDGTTLAFRRLRSEIDATSAAARQLTFQPGAGGPPRLVNGIGPGGTQRMLPGAGGAVPTTAGGSGAGSSPGEAGGLGRLIGTAIAGAIAQAVGRAVSDSLRTEADAQIEQLRSRDRSLGGIGANIADQSVRGLPLVGPIFGAGADIATSGSRYALDRSNRQFARAQENRDRIRTEQGIYGQQYQALGQLQYQGRDAIFGAQLDAQSGQFRVRDQVNRIAQQQREQRVFNALGAPIAGDLVYGRQAFGSAAGDLQREIGNRPVPTNQEAIFRNQQEIARQRQELQNAQARQANAAQISDASGLVRRGNTQGNRVTVDAVRTEALQAEMQAAQRLVELERQRGQLTQQAAQAEAERLGRIREQATAGAQAYRAQAEQERLRQQGLREQFGSMTALQRRQVLQVSRAVRNGQTLTPEQERIARENGGIFEGALRQINNRRAGQSGFDEIAQNVGLDQRQREAERRAAQLEQIAVQANTQVTATLQTSANQDANAIAQQLAPLILQALQAQAAAIGEATQRQLQEQATRPQTTVVQ